MVSKFWRVIFTVIYAIVIMMIAMYVLCASPFHLSSEVYVRATNVLAVLAVMLAAVLLLRALIEAYSDGEGRFAGEDKLIAGETYTIEWRGPEIVRGGINRRCECYIVVKLVREDGKKEYIPVVCSDTPPDVFVKTRDKNKPFAAVTA